MALSKLAARLRSHDWTAALIELLIVILGILIALQVSTWNQGRLDRARADSYYRRIAAELHADADRIEKTRVFWKQVSDYGLGAIAYGERGELVRGSAWKTVLAYYQASQIMPFELEDTSFNEMRDAGDLSLIPDEGLRKRLADYYRLTGKGITAQVLHHDPVYRMQVRGMTPTGVQLYIWDHCFHQLGGVYQQLVDCPSPISESDAVSLLQTYRNSPDLLQNLRYWNTSLMVSTIVLGVAEDEGKNLAPDVAKAEQQH
jgi:hypothetical protein